MRSRKCKNIIEKNRAVLEATEQIISLEQPILAENQTINCPGMPQMSQGQTFLLCLVLITQALIFYWQKRDGK